eukprot:TRINITY_DN11546_c0_g1_i1.p1 TRINITY_DN11546_c0_g1~~TRINITY_DN11546_c0_g1_i1.p1  ORF type:complete len:508 (-),score=151.65 TRINITY_DN11546_c0_g1_i1:480-2003(-)
MNAGSDSFSVIRRRRRDPSNNMGRSYSKEAHHTLEGFQLLSQKDDEEEDEEFIHLSESMDDVRVVPSSSSGSSSGEDEKEETALWITFQIFIPFLLAGLGMVGAGLVLDSVQHWEVFENVSEIFILVPALLGLKGNLEMTLASRLSTHAHLGHLDTPKNIYSLVLGNLALVQCQGIVVGFLASAFAIIMGLLRSSDTQIVDEFYHGLLLCASSVVTASIASLVLGLIMIAVILLSKRLKLNPDNIATPIAASLGDLTTLALLSWIAQLLYDDLDKDKWLAPTIIVFYICLIPLAAWLAYRNEHTSRVLANGWTPVLMAMVISSLGGVILDFAVVRYEGIAVYQPVMNGVGGNLVAVQASRISTYLHTKSPSLGTLPDHHSKRICLNPFSMFKSSPSNPHATTARILILLMVPGQLLFTYTISLLQAGHTSPTPMFIGAYLSAALIQIYILLHTAQWLIHWMWLRAIDPDNSAIPYLTALGDLLGTGLLAIAFEALYLLGDRDSDVGD